MPAQASTAAARALRPKRAPLIEVPAFAGMTLKRL